MRLRKRQSGFWFWALLAVAVWAGEDVCLLLLAAAAHELGHLAVLYLCGGRLGSVRIGAYGIRMRARFSSPPSQRAQAAMLLAGPAAGLLAAAIALLSGNFRFAHISAGLSFFNLLPLRGLDGGSLRELLR